MDQSFIDGQSSYVDFTASETPHLPEVFQIEREAIVDSCTQATKDEGVAPLPTLYKPKKRKNHRGGKKNRKNGKGKGKGKTNLSAVAGEGDDATAASTAARNAETMIEQAGLDNISKASLSKSAILEVEHPEGEPEKYFTIEIHQNISKLHPGGTDIDLNGSPAERDSPPINGEFQKRADRTPATQGNTSATTPQPENRVPKEEESLIGLSQTTSILSFESNSSPTSCESYISQESSITTASSPPSSPPQSSESLSTKLYEINPSPSKDLGLFATSHLAAGTRILSELSLALFPSTTSDCIIPIIENLNPTDFSTFMALHRNEDPARDAELAAIMTIFESEKPVEERSRLSIDEQVAAQTIVWANSHAAGEGGGIFPVASRINHSCVPNVYHSWNENLQTLTVHAIREITAGEELFTTYIPLCLSRATRNDEDHLGRYGFTCTCPSCDLSAPSGRQSATRRTIMAAFSNFLTQYASHTALGTRTIPFPPDAEAFKIAKRLVNLMKTEEIRNMELAYWLHILSQLALLSSTTSIFSAAVQYAQEALEVTETCTGRDSMEFEYFLRAVVKMQRGVKAKEAEDAGRGKL